jgi:8-oxo-dGTP diphosphatase
MFCHSCGHRLKAAPPTRCTSCGVEHWDDARPCASALVVHQSRLLLVKRAQDPWKGLWDVPGGFCNPGEHPILTAQREIFEEVGIDVVVVGLLGMWLDTYGDARRTLNIYYHARPTGPRDGALDSSEVVQAKWFLPTELPDGLAFPRHVPAALEAWQRAARDSAFVSPLLDRPADA